MTRHILSETYKGMHGEIGCNCEVYSQRGCHILYVNRKRPDWMKIVLIVRGLQETLVEFSVGNGLQIAAMVHTPEPGMDEDPHNRVVRCTLIYSGVKQDRFPRLMETLRQKVVKQFSYDNVNNLSGVDRN